jgi:cell division septation protein DedD
MAGPTPIPPTGVRRAAPELVAVLLGVIVWIAVGAGVLATSGRGGTAGPTGSAAVIGASAAPSRAAIDPSLLALLRSVHDRLRQNNELLESDIASETLDMSALPLLVRQTNNTLSYGVDVATTIGEEPVGRAFSRALLAAYAGPLETIKAILALSLTNESGYRAGVTTLIRQLRALPDIDALLARTQSSPGAAQPTETPASTATPTKTPKPTKTPAPTPTVAPTQAPTEAPTASAVPPSSSALPNALTNPGFESGSDGWTFTPGSGVSAAFDVTDEAPHGGTKVGRITIAAGAGDWSAATLSQAGIQLSNGQTRQLTIWARASAPRDIRVRVTNELGQVLLSRTFSVTTEWQGFTATLTAIGEVRDGSLLIETGASAEPVWLDDLSFG